MEATPASIKFTHDDVLNFRADGRRHEIIDGEHYVTPSPNTKHHDVLTTPLLPGFSAILADVFASRI